MKHLYLILTGLFVSVISMQAQFWTQTGDNINGEGNYDYFGFSVSLNSDGTILAIGAKDNYPLNMGAGYVKVFQNNSGVWSQIGQKISGENTFDEFGFSVSLNDDGTVLAVGIPYKEGFVPASHYGQVRVFQYIDGSWQQKGGNIDGAESGEFFGRSVSINDDGSIVAAGTFDVNITNAPGIVRVYQFNNGDWEQIGSDIVGETPGDYFGVSISLNSDGAIIAAGATDNDGNGTDAGQVRVFQNNNGNWEQIGDDIYGEAPLDLSGFSVSLNSDGSVVAIGAIENDGSYTDAGQVRVFKNNDGEWEQIGEDIDGEAAYDYSGWSVSLSSDGNIVAVGAQYNDGNGIDAGHVRVFQNYNGIWEQTGADINGEVAGDLSGTVSLSSDGLIVSVGAALNDDGGTDAGNVRVFENLTVGVENAIPKEISIYPNPSNGLLRIKNARGYVLSILDVTGSTVCNRVIEDNSCVIELDRSLSRGVYFANFKSQHHSFVTKIVVE